MPYLGTKGLKASDIRRFNVTGSTSATHTLTWVAPTEQSLIVTINGVKQQEDAYSVSGTTLTLTSALVATDKMEVVGINDVGTTVTPAQNSVNLDKLATTGTPSSSTFLRGDMAWTAVSDTSGFASAQTFTSSGTWTKPSGITKINITIIGGGAGGAGASNQYGAGSGGAGGAVIKYAHDVSSISTATITIGSGGSGGYNGVVGTDGGNSTYVDTSLTLTAGGGDSDATTHGSASGGDINLVGEAGDSAHIYGYNLGSKGGSTILGGGGEMAYYSYTGRDAVGYGSGGGGGGREPGTGGSGASGICIIEEYK